MALRLNKKEPQINLLPDKGFSETPAGRVLTWIVSTFRVIVIVTELLVMVAFLSRFWLDAQINDQREEITNKQAAISTTSAFEKEFRSLQTKVRLYTALTSPGPEMGKWLSQITSGLPPDVYLTAITSNKSGVSIEGASPNEASIQQLLVNVQSLPSFTDASITDLKSNEEDPSLFNFRITVPKTNS
jgi:Tfp pilus assembly protein PilN